MEIKLLLDVRRIKFMTLNRDKYFKFDVRSIDRH